MSMEIHLSTFLIQQVKTGLLIGHQHEIILQ